MYHQTPQGLSRDVKLQSANFREESDNIAFFKCQQTLENNRTSDVIADHYIIKK